MMPELDGFETCRRLKASEKRHAIPVIFLTAKTETADIMRGFELGAVVELLNDLFTRFDLAARELGIEKIKTIGDAYMAVCGLSDAHADHADRMVRMALRLQEIARGFGEERSAAVRLRVGINAGPVVAGVIGRSKFIYDLLSDRYPFELRGLVEVKGKGPVEAWTLSGG